MRSNLKWRLVTLLAVTAVTVAALPGPAVAVPVELDAVKDGPIDLATSTYVCDTDPARATVPGMIARGIAQQGPVEPTNHGGDMAFWGDRALIACGADDGDLRNDGFAIVDISEPNAPNKVGHFACTASASDVGIWGDLVFMAVDRNSDASTRGPEGEACDAPTVAAARVRDITTDPDDKIFVGVRVVRIDENKVDETGAFEPAEIVNIPLGGVGAHNITLVPDIENLDANGNPKNVLVYASMPAIRPNDLPVVGNEVPVVGKVNETPPLRNQLLAVPLDNPAAYKTQPLWTGDVATCHDISFFLPRGLMACNRGVVGTMLMDVRAGDGIGVNDDELYVGIEDSLDDSRPSLRNPRVIAFLRSHAEGPSFPVTGRLGSTTAIYAHHSSAFSWDGTKLVVSDENFWYGYSTNTCPADPEPIAGSLFFYDISNLPELIRKNVAKEHIDPVAHQLPPPVNGNGACMSKQLNVLPLRDGRDVLVASWVGGGTSVVDFTHLNGIKQLAYYAASPGTDYRSFVWSSYWYNGRIYANNVTGCGFVNVVCGGAINRGLDIFTLGNQGKMDLSRALTMPYFNFGLQECLPGDFGDAHDARVDYSGEPASDLPLPDFSCATATEREPTTLTFQVVGPGGSRHELRAQLNETASGAPVEGRSVSFLANGKEFAVGVTDATGFSTVSIPPSLRGDGNVYSAMFSGDDSYEASTSA